MAARLFMGVDVGTGGARVIVCDEWGKPVAESSRPFAAKAGALGLPAGWHQQSPEGWWEATAACIRDVLGSQQLKGAHDGIFSVSVTSTSGTVIPLGEGFEPLCDAVMYNDSRSSVQAERANEALGEVCRKLAYRFDASFGLPKMLWVMDSMPDLFVRTRLFAHAGDYIIGKLCGGFRFTDYSNSLKSGYDVADLRWPEEIEGLLGIPMSKLPEVLSPGTPVGKVSPACSAETGLPISASVSLGMTDGCASQIASGAASLGDWNTTIGTTLVIKGVTEKLLFDPKGRIYSHRHPDGHWMPGGASNVGGDCVRNNFRDDELDGLNASVEPGRPTGMLLYPLEKKGERFPNRDPLAEGFMVGSPSSRAELYQAYLEGVALVERMSYEMLQSLGAVVGDKVFAAGGATRSEPWLKIRANMLNRRIAVPEMTGGSMGAAILAASISHWGSLGEAARNMVRIVRTVGPDHAVVDAYNEKYGQFISEMHDRGYTREG